MSKTKSRWICQECGFQSSKLLGRCTECGNWNCLIEEIVTAANNPRATLASKFPQAQGDKGPVRLAEIDCSTSARTSSGIAGTDLLLGGGFVPGSVILLAGDPGIGKSTLLLQIAGTLAKNHRVLYVSAEESKQQVRLRGERLKMPGKDNLLVDCEQDVQVIRETMTREPLDFAFIDSIQAIYHGQLESAPGSVSQVRESAAELVATAKAKDICTVIVGHVTKDGSIAGPRVLEHMVDVVLHFEGDQSRQLRILRAVKNRFGSTSEITVFTMNEVGLTEIANPSQLFVGQRLSKEPGERAPSGTCVLAVAEGTKALLVEAQALVGISATGMPRRVANGCDNNRLLQIIAVLEKRVGLALSKQDVYVNIVGGFQSNDPAGDLGIAVAVATSYLDRSVDPLLACIGELGLTGEIRPVGSIERRLKELESMGFKTVLVPASNMGPDIRYRSTSMNIVKVDYLTDALTHVMPNLEVADTVPAQAPALVGTKATPPAPAQ